MSLSDLVFEWSSTGSADLVFGEFAEAVSLGTLEATIGPPSFASQVQHLTGGTLSATLDGPTLAATGQYSSGTDRPLVATVVHAWQEADAAETGATTGFTHGLVMVTGPSTGWTGTDPLVAGVSSPLASGMRLRGASSQRWQDADRVRTSAQALWQVMDRTARLPRRFRYQDADRVGMATLASWQNMLHDRRPMLHPRWQSADQRRRSYTGRMQAGLPVRQGRDFPWQEAMRPPAGITPHPIGPGPDPCYIPSPHLVFDVRWTNTTGLVFYCERHDSTPPGPHATVVVPIRSVYMIVNTVTLKRVVGNVTLPCLSLSLSLDVDSWAWGFNATLPADQLDAVAPTITGPVELEAVVNGTAFRLLAENISRDRTFGRSTLKVGGRGKAALLAAPYAPVQTVGNTGDRTAQQLMGDILTYNGVPLDWTVDWQIEDWLVPGGVFQAQGTYIEGLGAVAAAAGAFLRPHPTDQSISVLARYPSLPRDWYSLTPDFELPSAVVTQEGITWTERPGYNRVFVSGTSQGVLGQVTLLGSAGDLVAPMVTDPLITTAAAARQRGMAVLGNTGRQADVRLRLPVLAETGIIQPGALVRYTDGGIERLGMVRSTAVDAGLPEVWQSLGVETHVS